MPTVFTNTEIGKQLQKMWLMENQAILSKTYRENKSDLILVTPHDNAGKNSACAFMKSDEIENLRTIDRVITDRISNYVLKNKSEGKVIVIFMNLEGRLSYYTCLDIGNTMEEK